MNEQPIVSWKLRAKSVATSGSVHDMIVSVKKQSLVGELVTLHLRVQKQRYSGS